MSEIVVQREKIGEKGEIFIFTYNGPDSPNWKLGEAIANYFGNKPHKVLINANMEDARTRVVMIGNLDAPEVDFETLKKSA